MAFRKPETGAFAPFIHSFIFYFYLFFIFALSPRSQSRGYFPQPAITQLGHPRSQIRGFFLSQSKITQQGLLPISNWGIFFFLSPRSHSKGCSRSQIGGFFLSQPKITQQGLPQISNQGIFFSLYMDFIL